MAGEPIPGWDLVALIAGETNWGVVPTPVAAQATRFIDLNTGPVELGVIRPQRDRQPGRGMQAAFVEGRVKPIPFDFLKSIMSRAANDTVPDESVLYKAAGLLQTVNAGVSVAYTTPASPGLDGSLVQASIYRVLGKDPYTLLGEQLRGCVLKSLIFSGGDKELELKGAGEAIGKYHLGYVDSVTLAAAGTLSITFASADEGDLVREGYYLIESEVIQVTAKPTSTTATIARGINGTTAAAHAAKPMRPYIPSLFFTGSPIPEGGTVTCTLDAVTMRIISFTVNLISGIDMLPGESGSKYVQGAKVIRYEAKVSLKLMMARTAAVALMGKCFRKKSVALTLVQSTGTAGGIVTIALPTCEIDPFVVPAPPNDSVMIDVNLRVRDNSGNDAITITYT